MTEIDILPAARPLQAGAVEQLQQHAVAMGAAKQLADALCGTDLVPEVYRGNPGNGAAAILYGAELGLSPIQSLQNIMVIKGRPAIYARTAVALVNAAGIIVQTVESTDDEVTVSATDPRTGAVEVATWTTARAQRAGYTSNKLYQTDPQSMLYARAAMEVCRRIAPHILLGITYSREELDAEQVTSVRVVRHKPAATQVSELLAAQDSPVSSLSSEPADPDALSPAARKNWLKRMFAALNEADCPDPDDQRVVIGMLAGHNAPVEHRDEITDHELRTVVGALAAASKEHRLGDVITELLNTHALIEANDEEQADE